MKQLGDWLRAVTQQVRAALPSQTPLSDDDASAASPTVVLLPGVLEPAGFLRPLGGWLTRHGYRVHYLPELGWNLRSVKDSAALVTRRINRLKATKVLVVAHSKGGLIGKAAMLRTDGRKIVGMVALCTPFSGSDFLQPLHKLLPLTPGLAELTSGHPTLSELNSQSEVNSRIVSLIPAWDQVVQEHSMFLPGALTERLSAGGHFGAALSPITWQRLHSNLKYLLSN